jgi:hypothetical protein
MLIIGEKTYNLVEITGRKYQALMDRFTKEFGEEWHGKGGILMTSILLAACLKADDGTSPTEDEVLDQPIRVINALSREAMVLNGITAESQAQTEKN